MNITETSNALALAQAFDNRTVGEVNVRAWHAVLGDLDAGRVMEAIRRHYGRTTDWLMPAHVRRIVGEIEQEQAKAGRRWAAGQAGVPADAPMPELESGWAKAGFFGPDVQALIDEVRGRLAARYDNDRAKLFPRQAYWEREHRAYLRSHDGEPNPLYRLGPLTDVGTPCGVPSPHPGHEWSIGPNEGETERDKFWCPGVSAERQYAPLSGLCGACGAESQDLGAHRRDYPNGSCA